MADPTPRPREKAGPALQKSTSDSDEDEIDFPDPGRRKEVQRFVRRSNGWRLVDWPQIAAKHYTHSVFRALEAGAAVAKSEYSVDSAIVDGFGRIAASTVTPDGSAAVLVADVPLRSGMPLAALLVYPPAAAFTRSHALRQAVGQRPLNQEPSGMRNTVP
jgi:hypothetical protein